MELNGGTQILPSIFGEAGPAWAGSWTMKQLVPLIGFSIVA